MKPGLLCLPGGVQLGISALVSKEDTIRTARECVREPGTIPGTAGAFWGAFRGIVQQLH